MPPDSFDPDGVTDARRKAIAALAQREGQPAFRRRLLEAYGRRCAISACDLIDVLEAAHIVPYWGPRTNHVQNGLLLRADLHTLFDRGLFGIDPSTHKVVASPRLAGSQYGHLDQQRVFLPRDEALRPSIRALKAHLDSTGLQPVESKADGHLEKPQRSRIDAPA
jgi:predicted restriction endonuclease